MSQQSINSLLDKETVTDEDIDTIVYDENTLLSVDPEFSSGDQSPVDKPVGKASRGEKDQSLETSEKRDETGEMSEVQEAIMTLMETIDQRIEASEERRHGKLKEARKKLEETVKEYKTGSSSEAEVKFLRNIIRYQHAAQQAITEIIEEEIDEQSKVIDEVERASGELVQKNKELIEQLRKMREEPRCFYCDSTKHAAISCYQFKDWEERKTMLIEENRCHLCFKKGHETESCPDSKKYEICKKCKQEKHHVSLCPIYATKERTEMKHLRSSNQKRGDKEGETSGRHEEEKKDLDGPEQSSSGSKKRQPILPP